MSFTDCLNVTVIEARNLPGLDSHGLSDPLLIAKSDFSRQQFKTKALKKTITPKWSQMFTFFTSKPEGKIHIRVLSKGLFKDKPLGEVVLNIERFADGVEHDTWFALVNGPENKRPENPEIHLKVQFFGDKKVTPTVASYANGQNSSPYQNQPRIQEEQPQAQKNNLSTSSSSSSSGQPSSRKPPSIEDSYDLGKVLGRGAFSVVKEGTRKKNNKKYAIKCIDKKSIDKKELALLEREIDIMKKLQHPNIIQLMEVIDSKDTLYLVLEYVSGGELFDSIVNRGSYTEEEAAKIIKQILDAINYVHSLGIAHRDLKPENLLLLGDGSDTVKIADFGLSKDFSEEKLSTSCGTPDYVAPEVLMGDTYDKSVDIWSIGVITYVLLCGFPPFYGDSQKDLFENIMKGNYDFPDPEWKYVSDEAKDFIKKILVVSADDRASAEECLNHPWIKEYAEKDTKDLKRMQSFSAEKFKEYNQKYKKNQNVFRIE